MKSFIIIFLISHPLLIVAQKYCPEKLFISSKTLPEKIFTFSSNDTLLICGETYSLKNGMSSGLFAIINGKNDSIYKYFTEVDYLRINFKHDTLKVIEYSSFIDLKTDSFRVYPFAENIITPFAKKLVFTRNFIFRFPILSKEEQKEILSEHNQLMLKKGSDKPEKFHLSHMKNLIKVFYCALNDNKDAQRILFNYEQIIRKNDLLIDFGGETNELHYTLFNIYKMNKK